LEGRGFEREEDERQTICREEWFVGGRCERERYERIRVLVFDVCLGIYSAKV